MTVEPFELDVLLIDWIWQSSALLALALVAGRLVGRRCPARAHGIILAGLIAAVVAPLLSVVSRLMGWGMLAPLELAGVADGSLPPMDQWGRGTGAVLALGVVEILAVAWLAASAILVTRLALSLDRALRLVSGAVPASEPLRDIARSVAARLGWSCAPEVCFSSGVRTPVIWCWGRRPRVLLPAAAEPQHDAELRDVICHELAHLQRRDHLSSLVGELAVCLMPWNPLAWLAGRKLRELSERACDAWVLAAGAAPAAYAQTLLGLAARPQVGVGLAAVSTRRGIGGRIFWILESRVARPELGRVFRVALAIGGAFVVSCAALAHHRPAEAVPSPDLALIGSPTRPPAAADGLIFVPDELDLGVVEPGESSRGTLWLVNAGDEPYNVTAARPECGCTVVAGFEPTEIAPGGSLRLEIEMIAGTQRGTRKTKHVRFTIEGQPQLRVPVHITTAGVAGPRPVTAR